MINTEEVQEIMDVIRSRYKSLQSPDFSFVRDTISQHLYEKVVRQLRKHFQVEEDTDPNDDVSFGYGLQKGNERWVLRISMLGPYAVLLRLHETARVEVLAPRPHATSSSEQTLLTTLTDHGIRVLDREALLTPVPLRLLNAEPENTECIRRYLLTQISCLGRMSLDKDKNA